MGQKFHKALSKLLFQAPEPSYEHNRAILSIQTKNRDLIAAFFFNLGAENTILFSHANAEDLGLVVRHVKHLARELNVNIFCYDYTGYGLSTWREKRLDLNPDLLEGVDFVDEHGQLTNSSSLRGEKADRGGAPPRTSTTSTGSSAATVPFIVSDSEQSRRNSSLRDTSSTSSVLSTSSVSATPSSRPRSARASPRRADATTSIGSADEDDLPCPSEESVNADVEAAYTYMRVVLNIPAHRIILYGRSIGTGPTCHLATVAPVKAVILQAPLASVFRILFNLRFSLPLDRFCNIDRVSEIDSPVFLMHGLADEIVPVWHGLELMGCIREETCYVQGTRNS